MRKSSILRKGIAAAAAVALGAGLTSCASAEDADNSDEITLGYIAWDEAIAVSNLWKHILEDEGYTVELEELDAGLIFEGLANGDVDFFVDMWLPTTHAEYQEKYGDDLEEHGVWYDNASLAIAVPQYMDVTSLEDLNDYADDVNGEIIGIEEGAGLTQATQDNVLPDYELEDNFELKTSSTPAMLETLDVAYEKEEPIVVTLWHPHWAYSTYDMVDLEDPEGSLGEAEEISNVARDGFGDDFPDVADMLGNFQMDDAQLAELEDIALNQSDDPEAGAEEWYKDNSDFVDGLK